MKRLILAAMALIPIMAFSQIPNLTPFNNFNVGASPVDIFVNFTNEDSEFIYILCYGKDTEPSGVVNDGDIKPSIWKFNPDMIGSEELVAEIEDFFPVFPVRTFSVTNIYQIPLSDGSVIGFDMDTEELLTEPVYEGDVKIVFEGGLELSYVVEVDAGGKSTFTGTFGGFPVQLDLSDHVTNLSFYSYNDNIYLITTNHDGNYDNWYYESGPVVIGLGILWESEKVNIGSTLNHIAVPLNDDFDKLRIAITSNMTHEIYEVDPESGETVQTIELPSEGFNGPRNSFFLSEDLAAVSSYDNNLYIVDFASGEYISLPAEGKTEALLGSGEGFLFTNIYQDDSYEPEYIVGGYFVAASVEEEVEFGISPSMITNTAVITTDDYLDGEYQVYSINGVLVNEGKIIGGEAQLSINEFPAQGLYYVKIGNSIEPVAIKK